MFAYCNNDPVQMKDSTGDFCVPTAIVGGIIDAGVSIICTCADAASNNKAVNSKELLLDATLAFASGFVSNGSEVAMVKKMISIGQTAYAFGSTVARGGSIDEAAVNAATTIVTGKVGSKVSNVVLNSTKKTVVDNIAAKIVSSNATTSISFIKSIGISIRKMFSRNSNRNTNHSNSREVRGFNEKVNEY